MRGNDIPINGPIIQEKAREFADAFDCIDWIATRLERGR